MTSNLRHLSGVQSPDVSTLADLFTGGHETRWMTQGACLPDDVRAVFDRATDGVAYCIEAAIDICQTCPVLDKCHPWGIKQHRDEGVIGGMNQYQRQVAAGARKSRSLPDDASGETVTIQQIVDATGLTVDGAKNRLELLGIQRIGKRGRISVYPSHPQLFVKRGTRVVV